MNPNPWRLRLAFGIIVLLVVWPVIHMLLAHSLNFAPSRFGGWAMYSAPDQEFTGVEIFLLAPGVHPPANLLQPPPEGRIPFPFEPNLRVVTREGVAVVKDEDLPPELLRALGRDIAAIRALRRPAAVAALAARLAAMKPRPAAFDRVLVILIYPHLNLAEGYTFTEIEGFLYSNGALERFPRQRTDRISTSQYLQSLGL